MAEKSIKNKEVKKKKAESTTTAKPAKKPKKTY